ncbi:DUF2061 domain-containing protein [Flavobacteriales bacterium]|jgi:uncharacterized membrane protein|nr:DUF2061 domain-containing protein [Flavobacteriales bacterium]
MKDQEHDYKDESQLRSLVKSFSWRVIAITDTVLIVLLITCLSGECGIEDALAIGFIEFLLKFVVYFMHERAWVNIQFNKRFGKNRTLYKTISWRAVATIMTFMVAGAILEPTDNTAYYIAGIEIFTKTLLYYVHERLWLSLPLGGLRIRLKKMIYGKKYR